MLESNRTPQQQSTSIGVQTHAYGLVFQDFDVIFWINSHKLHVHVVYCYNLTRFNFRIAFAAVVVVNCHIKMLAKKTHRIFVLSFTFRCSLVYFSLIVFV